MLLLLTRACLASQLNTKLVSTDLLRSPSFFSNTTASNDDDFFNEPSVMRPRLTASAANNKDENTSTNAVSSPVDSSHAYSVTARGANVMYYAALSA
jgi:hypothetical protein